MSSNYFKKPINALRRATELYHSGKPKLGIEVLHAVLTNRRHKQWTQTHEEMIKLYLRICVDLRKKIYAKDGLYTYRSLCQREAPGSLETVVNHLIDLAEQKCTEARELAGDKLKMSELAGQEDENAAENIILSSVNSHGTSRVDKELVVPWIKFLWEAYRSVLEVTKNNNRLIDVYQNTVARAYKFCETYERTLEFRKLNDQVKKHLQDSIKYYEKDRESGKKHGLIELNADYFELHLNTRFLGLESATKMKQWNQAYQIVEEIYSIMAKIDRPIQPQMMAAYYKSLSDMFLVSKSYLFHAYAWLKFYHLNEKNNQSLDNKELTRMASALTLSALAVPVVKRHDSISSYANDEADKKKRMAALLGYTFNPNRDTLLEQITSMGLLEHCEPWVQNLFSLLEKEFSPHDLVKNVVKHLEYMKAEDRFSEYCYGIEELLIIRLCQQLSKVYRTLTIDEFRARLTGVSLSYSEIERVILRAVRRHYLSVRLDYRFNCLRFDSGNLEIERTQGQLTQLGASLKKAADSIGIGQKTMDAKSNQKDQLIHFYFNTMESSRQLILERKIIIEKAKEMNEQRQRQETYNRQKAKQIAERAASLAERERLMEEKKRREVDRVERKKQQEIMQKKRDIAKKMNLNMNEQQLQELTGEDLMKQREQAAIKEAKKKNAKMRAQSNQVDYLCRAIRENEREVLTQHIKEKMDAEEARFMNEAQKEGVKHRAAWELACVEQKRTNKMMNHRTPYEDALFAVRSERLVSERETLIQLARLQKRKDKIARAKATITANAQRKIQEEEAAAQAIIDAAEAKEKAEEAERVKEEAEGGWRRASNDPRNRQRDEDAKTQRRQPPPQRDERQRDDRQNNDRSYGGDRYSNRNSGSRDGGGSSGGAYRPPGSRGGGGGDSDRYSSRNNEDRRGGDRGGDRQGGGDRYSSRGNSDRRGGGDRYSSRSNGGDRQGGGGGGAYRPPQRDGGNRRDNNNGDSGNRDSNNSGAYRPPSKRW